MKVENQYDLRVESRFKNGLLFNSLTQILGEGWTQNEAAEFLGVPPIEFSKLIRLRIRPKYPQDRAHGSGPLVWRRAVTRISSKLGYSPQDLFPDSLYSLALPDVYVREFCSPEVLSLQDASIAALLNPIDGASVALSRIRQQELRTREAKVLSTLSPREQSVLSMRFGLNDGSEKSLEEIAEMFGVSKERVRQIEAKGLRKLRHPSRSHILREYLDETA